MEEGVCVGQISGMGDQFYFKAFLERIMSVFEEEGSLPCFCSESHHDLEGLSLGEGSMERITVIVAVEEWFFSLQGELSVLLSGRQGRGGI